MRFVPFRRHPHVGTLLVGVVATAGVCFTLLSRPVWTRKSVDGEPEDVQSILHPPTAPCGGLRYVEWKSVTFWDRVHDMRRSYEVGGDAATVARSYRADLEHAGLSGAWSVLAGCLAATGWLAVVRPWDRNPG